MTNPCSPLSEVGTSRVDAVISAPGGASRDALQRPPTSECVPSRQPENPRRDHVHRWWSSTAHLDHCCCRGCDASLKARGIRDPLTVSGIVVADGPGEVTLFT